MTPYPQWPWSLKGLFWLALIWSVKLAEPFLAPITMAVVLAFLLAPGVRALRRRGLPVPAGAAVMLLLLLAVAGLLVGALAQPAAQWWERAPTVLARVLEQIDRARDAIPLVRDAAPQPTASTSLPLPTPTIESPASKPALRRAADGKAPAQTTPLPALPLPAKTSSADPLKDKLASEGVVLTGALLSRALSFAVSTTVTLILLFFLLTSEHWMVSRIVEAFPARRTRAIVLLVLRSAQRDIGRFLGTLGLIYGGVGLLTMLGVAWLGLPNPLLWGVLTAVLNFVPYLGPVLITVMLLLASLASFDAGPLVFGPPALFMVLHMIESNFISPWFVAQRLALSPIAVFVSVLFWGWMWGFVGAVVAVPLLVGFRSVCRRVASLRLLHLLLQGNLVRPPSLRSLLRVRPRIGVRASARRGPK